MHQSKYWLSVKGIIEISGKEPSTIACLVHLNSQQLRHRFNQHVHQQMNRYMNRHMMDLYVGIKRMEFCYLQQHTQNWKTLCAIE